MKSFLKWAGGKQRVLKHILKVLPSGKRLIEPFAGSAVVFLNTDYPENVLADNSKDLIDLFLQLQHYGQEFIDYSQQFFVPENNCKEMYLRLRDRFNSSNDPRERAGIFIYLNRHGYNGLCRYNSKGIFNVPYGMFKDPRFPWERMQENHIKFQNAKIMQKDFRETMKLARRGDVVYCDPPYVPLTRTASFTSYSEQGFGEAEQLILAETAERLAARGVSVVISNHDTSFTRELYEEAAHIISFPVQRQISCQISNRKPVKELLAVYLPEC